MKTKQVIVMRKDLGMRKGKMISQGAHASMAVFTNGLTLGDFILNDAGVICLSPNYFVGRRHMLHLEPGEDPVKEWFESSFTKICVSVSSEADLNLIHHKAFSLGLPCSMIIDNGLTEFAGVRTKTACAIGPWYSHRLDDITGNLQLL